MLRQGRSQERGKRIKKRWKSRWIRTLMDEQILSKLAASGWGSKRPAGRQPDIERERWERVEKGRWERRGRWLRSESGTRTVCLTCGRGVRGHIIMGLRLLLLQSIDEYRLLHHSISITWPTLYFFSCFSDFLSLVVFLILTSRSVAYPKSEKDWLEWLWQSQAYEISDHANSLLSKTKSQTSRFVNTDYLSISRLSHESLPLFHQNINGACFTPEQPAATNTVFVLPGLICALAPWSSALCETLWPCILEGLAC